MCTLHNKVNCNNMYSYAHITTTFTVKGRLHVCAMVLVSTSSSSVILIGNTDNFFPMYFPQFHIHPLWCIGNQQMLATTHGFRKWHDYTRDVQRKNFLYLMLIGLELFPSPIQSNKCWIFFTQQATVLMIEFPKFFVVCHIHISPLMMSFKESLHLILKFYLQR